MGVGFFEKVRADSETWDLGLAKLNDIEENEKILWKPNSFVCPLEIIMYADTLGKSC